MKKYQNSKKIFFKYQDILGNLTFLFSYLVVMFSYLVANVHIDESIMFYTKIHFLNHCLHSKILLKNVITTKVMLFIVKKEGKNI